MACRSHRTFPLCLGSLLFSTLGPAQEMRETPHGRLETLHGYTVVSLEGTPQEMGKACGQLLGPTIRRVVQAMITDGIGRDRAAYENILAGSRRMEAHQPADYREEVRAMAEAARVAYDDLLLLQYFGDVRRCISGPGSSALCTSFAVLPPNTGEEVCLVGRNLDYFDHGVGEYASILVHYRPEGKIPFVTVTWAGIVNGWTLLSLKGIVVSNNTAFGARKESLEGISTCFLLRYVAERAGSLDEGIALVRQAKRACGTNMLIAAGRPPGGAILEFDSERVMVRRPTRGFVGAANSFLSLYDKDVEGEVFHGGRLGCVQNLVDGRRGRLGLSDNLAGAEGVPITTMNLHSAMIDATNLRIRVAMGRIPAYRLPYRAFRLTERRLVAEEEVDSADGKAAEGE